LKTPDRFKTLERSAGASLWRNTLCHIVSVFGRLVYLTNLRNQNTSRYEHDGLTLMFGGDETNKALRKAHSKAFAEWLSFDIEQQKADLDLYISALPADKRTVLEAWTNLAPYRNLVPNSVRPVERKLYLADFKAILALLTNEYDVSCPDPNA
jgi:hypothetical protein